MKARAKQRTFFSKHRCEPNICVLEPISFTPTSSTSRQTRGGDRDDEERFWNQFEHADTFGALIQAGRRRSSSRSRPHLDGDVDDEGDLIRHDARASARGEVLDQAEYLSPATHVVVANPPYMGSKNMGASCRAGWRRDYPRRKSDLYDDVHGAVLEL